MRGMNKVYEIWRATWEATKDIAPPVLFVVGVAALFALIL